MSLTLSSEIEAALATGHIQPIEVVRVWGGDWNLYWSSAPVPSKYSEGINYDPRLVPLSELPFQIGSDDDSIDLEVDNSGGYVRDQIDRGKRFHRARVEVLRMFLGIDPPNHLIGSFGTPYWGGTITKLKLTQRTAVFTVASGLLQLNRRALLKLDRSCSAQFADALTCPYDPAAGKGLPESRFTGTATGGSGTTLVDSGADFTDVQPGWVVVNLTDKSAARVTSVATTTLTCEQGFANGTDNTMTSGDSYVVGPEFETCPLSVSSCMDRGMFGPAKQITAAKLNKDQRRYFLGFADPARVPFLTKVRDPSGKSRGRFTHTAHGNSGVEGTPVPYILGSWRNRDCVLAAVAYEDAFIDALWIVGMGRLISISNPLMDGEGPDNPDRSRPNAYEAESFHVFNVEQYAAANDSGSTDLTDEQRRLGIGSRGSYGVSIPNAYDTYANIPYLFADATGHGPSWSRVAGFRIRTEPSQGVGNSSLPTASADVRGAWCRLVPGGPSDQGVVGWTAFPNPVDAAYHVIRDTVAGAGLSDTQIDTASFVTASNVCHARIVNTQSKAAPITGTVSYGPDDAGTTIPSGERDVVWVTTAQEVPGQDLIGSTITITTSGGNTSRVIVSALSRFIGPPENDFSTSAIGRPYQPKAGFGGQSVIEIQVDAEWDAGKVPAQGDVFTVIDPRRVPRYKFNGALTDPNSVGEVLESILDNCDGQFVQTNGKISVVIPQAVDLDAIDALTVYADKGAGRNIVHRNGVSTLEWEADDIEDSPNAIVVEFTDAQNGYEETRRKVWNRTAQEAVGKAFGELRREKEEATLSLNGTASLDQAVRLAALRLRRRGPLPGNRPNGKVSFDCPIHDCQDLQPWADVRVIQSDQIPAYVGRHFRLVKMTDNPDKVTMRLEWRPHRNEWYDDTADDMGVEERPTGDFPPDEQPLQSVIVSVVSNPFFSAGEFHERVEVIFTPPVES